jgi:hypothetical protein
MSAPGESPAHYRVVYSGQVRTGLKELLARADALKVRPAIAAAVREIDARLGVYPQFGQPLRDLATKGETLWVGAFGPLVVHYVIDEPRRLVFVVIPFKPLPRLGL